MKKNLKLTAVVFLLIFSISCEKDESVLDVETQNQTESKVLSNKTNESNSKFIRTFCRIDGPDKGCKSDDVTYTTSTDIVNPIYNWSIVSGNISSTIIGQGTDTATFQLGAFFNGGSVKVEITSSTNSDNCTFFQDIALCRVIGGGSCSCPNPVIDDRLCVSGGHPHWRFQVDGISSSDQITWSINHGTIRSNPNQSYVIIEPNSGSIHGFTVYCRVERTCPDGSKKVRTAYYTNYYGNSCGTGTTGFVGSCSGGDMIDDLE